MSDQGLPARPDNTRSAAEQHLEALDLVAGADGSGVIDAAQLARWGVEPGTHRRVVPVTPAASTARRRSLRGALVLALDPGSATRSGELAGLFAGVLVQAAGGRETAPAVVGDMIDILQRVDSDADTTRPHLAARARTAPGASVAPEAASG